MHLRQRRGRRIHLALNNLVSRHRRVERGLLRLRCRQGLCFCCGQLQAQRMDRGLLEDSNMAGEMATWRSIQQQRHS